MKKVEAKEVESVEEEDASTLPSLEDLENEEDSLAMKRSKAQTQPTSSHRQPRRYLRLACVLWLGEFLSVILLKRCGMIHPDFRLDEAVKQSVLPQLESLLNETSIPLVARWAQEWSRLNESIPLQYLTQEKKRPGFQLASQGAEANYPVVMVPGFVTSGLETWGGKECARKHFRQRLWAAFGGARSFLMERDCWSEHMMLDPYTGGDPEGIRLRASQGFEAADYFLANYWVWSKIIENLADVGYTPSMMSMESYDWRLSFPMLEERDGFLTNLKSKIEALHKTTGKKVVLTTHSMGSLLVHYFFAWVTTSEKHGGGGGGRNWVDQHIHAYVNLAGSHLGVPKAASALLSGEMSDTIIFMSNMLEQFFGRRLRRDLWNTWGSLWAMLPKGGDALWSPGSDMCRTRASDDPFCPESGPTPLLAMTDIEDEPATTNGNEASDDPFCPESGPSPVLAMTDVEDEPTTTIGNDSSELNATLEQFLAQKSHMTVETLDFLLKYGAGLGPETAASKLYSLYGAEKPSSRTWHDPTRTPLPKAPRMRIYCMYGTGIDTERAYYYKFNRAEGDQTDPPIVIDSVMKNESQGVKHGVRYTDGDGSVPLISLGYVCADAWTRKDSGLNPSGTPVYTREYKHRAEFVVDDPMRNGPHSADHVDILGNVDMTEDLLRIVTDFGVSETNKDQIVSDIKNIAKAINAHPGGGIRRKRKWLP